jgi:hypothetical protein
MLQVYLWSFVDSLTCQSFYNRASNGIMAKLLQGWQGGSSAAGTKAEPAGLGSGQHVVLVNLDVADYFSELFQKLLATGHDLPGPLPDGQQRKQHSRPSYQVCASAQVTSLD